LLPNAESVARSLLRASHIDQEAKVKDKVKIYFSMLVGKQENYHEMSHTNTQGKVLIV
jgi:hypothetical protein